MPNYYNKNDFGWLKSIDDDLDLFAVHHFVSWLTMTKIELYISPF